MNVTIECGQRPTWSLLDWSIDILLYQYNITTCARTCGLLFGYLFFLSSKYSNSEQNNNPSALCTTLFPLFLFLGVNYYSCLCTCSMDYKFINIKYRMIETSYWKQYTKF